MPEPHHKVIYLAALAVAAVAAVIDWRSGKIPNWVTVPVALLAPLLHLARSAAGGLPSADALEASGYALAGGAVCAIVPLILFRQGALGGGDVKLLVALGALLQPRLGIEAEMYAFFAATVLAPAKLAYEGKFLTTLKNSLRIGANWFLPPARQQSLDVATFSSFRMGPAIFLGVAITAVLHRP